MKKKNLNFFSSFKVSDEKMQMIFGGYFELTNGSWHNTPRPGPTNDTATWCYSGDGPGGEVMEESYSLDKITDAAGNPLFARPVEPWDPTLPMGFEADAPLGSGT